MGLSYSTLLWWGAAAGLYFTCPSEHSFDLQKETTKLTMEAAKARYANDGFLSSTDAFVEGKCSSTLLASKAQRIDFTLFELFVMAEVTFSPLSQQCKRPFRCLWIGIFGSWYHLGALPLFRGSTNKIKNVP